MSAADGPGEVRGAAERPAPRRAIPDPRLTRIDATAPRLPAVPPTRLVADALRERFHRPPAWSPEFVDDRHPGSPAQLRPAAVLVPLVRRGAAPTVLLTVRTAHLSAHAGQIAFPGGRTEPTDASPVATALRESEEEIGLSRDRVEVLGQLPTYSTGTGFVVTPVVGLVDAEHVLRHDANEVADTFEVPLSFLMDPANHERRVYRWPDGMERSFYAMPWRTPDGTREYFIWGATAAMLRNFYRFLAD